MVEFGKSNVFKILNYLLEHKKEEFSIRQLAITLKIDYKTTYQTIEKIKDSINISAKGNSKFISYKSELTDSQYLTEKERVRKLLKNKTLKVLYDILGDLNEQFILVIFGSQAKGTANKHSDIDLLLVSDNAEALALRFDILPLPLHIIPLTNEEFTISLRSREFSVVSEATTHNYILEGIEPYYRFIQNVNKTTVD